MKYLPVILILLLILAVIIAIYIGISHLRNRAREVSRALFGTSDITKAAKQMKQEYSTTPRSVSAMTSLLLPKIVSDFPNFQYDEMKDRAENTLTSYLRAVTEANPSLLQDGNSELKIRSRCSRHRISRSIINRSKSTGQRSANTKRQPEDASSPSSLP